jgi:ribose transport system ATP-binding protein
VHSLRLRHHRADPAVTAPGSGSEPVALADTGPPRGSHIALSVRGVTKVFPGTRALDDVDLDVRYGEVHGLVGGNGSGKSTLIKILGGVLAADAGRVTISDRDLAVSEITAKTAQELGIRVVHQDPPLFPHLSIAENMMLSAGYPRSRLGSIGWPTVRRRARAQIEKFQIKATPDTLVRDLPVAMRAQVAIASALQDTAGVRSIIILDEPTSALPVYEVKLLLETVRQLAEMGHAIVFVSHRLDEVLALTDRVTVLRDGRVFRVHRTASLTEAELIESILGRRAEEIRAQRTSAPAGQPMLTVSGLSAGPLQDVSFEVCAGEVIGVAGLLGSGRSELLRAVCGDLDKTAGEILVRGRPANYSRIDQAISAGVVMIPEDRALGAVFADMTVDENLDISVLRWYWRGLGFRRSLMRRDADELRRKLRVKAPSGSAFMRTLSGGNQQKTILARWLRRDPVLLLLDEPTQGVDVGARGDIYGLIRDVTSAGGAAVVVTSDLEELAQFVDRAVVLRNGRLVAQVPYEDLSAHRLNQLVYTRGENAQ